MGIAKSYICNATGRLDDADPLPGLTSRDKYLIKMTWTKLSSKGVNEETGMAIFLTLFDKFPKYKELFPFRNIPNDQLKQNNKFRAHCVSVMYALTSIVQNIETPVLLEALLEKQGRSHATRGVENDAYKDLKEVLMELFSKSMNKIELESWDKFLTLGFEMIVKGADEVEKSNF